MQHLDKLLIGESVKEMHDPTSDLNRTRWSICAMDRITARVRDFVSRDLLQPEIMESEEEHVDFIETQLG